MKISQEKFTVYYSQVCPYVEYGVKESNKRENKSERIKARYINGHSV